ncbi:hypothetical protein E2C01_073216 [Portunus trituberculatus]|uniref:Uncharacterized protein n=1 Tax=Portunus trituberculatus TaxID=210409 RepID=A0A5B7I9Z6_PORTR|nr:hypothetical protein [Portunus trituberculatus]
MEAGFKQLMHKNVEAEAKGRKAEEHYSGEIQTLAQQVQELTAQLTITSHQHQAAMKAAQDHFSQQLAASQKQMRVIPEDCPYFVYVHDLERGLSRDSTHQLAFTAHHSGRRKCLAQTHFGL